MFLSSLLSEELTFVRAKIQISKRNTKGKPKFFFLFPSERKFSRSVRAKAQTKVNRAIVSTACLFSFLKRFLLLLQFLAS